jgi:uncharacterized membrane protein YbhN (UPF0104 family)/tRNA A-37 threonylcarbamoyl transferase component Bud32
LAILVLLFLAGGREHLSATRDVLLSILVAALVSIVLVRLFFDAWPHVLPELSHLEAEPQLPVLRVALLTAGLLAAGPHLARPLSRLGWAILVSVAVAGAVLGYGLPNDALAGVGTGMVAAGAVLLIFGSPSGYPDVAAVRNALAGIGHTFDEIHIDPDQSWGVRRLVAIGTDGRQCDIKAYGRDATDSQLLAKFWRGIWYKRHGPGLTYTRLQGVEHEALVTMMAARAGASVPEVIAAAEANNEVAVLVTTRVGRALGELHASEISDDVLERLWREVGAMHAASISHGNLSADAVRIDRDRPQLTDFLGGSLVATDVDSGLDTAELLFSLSVIVGAERAVAAAGRGLGTERLAAAMPYLQLPAVSHTTRRRAGNAKEVMQGLREAAVTVTGEDMPEPARLRRVTAKSLLMAGLLFFAAYAVIPMIAGIDFVAVWEVLRYADWSWIAAALLVGHVVFVPEASSMMFAAGVHLPLWQLTLLQVSVQFIGLAIPSVAGRIAMNAAFLRKYGVSTAESIAQGAIDSVSGFVVEAAILLVAFLAAEERLDLNLGSGDANWGLILVIVLFVLVGAVIAVRRIHRVRDLIMPALQGARGALAGIASSPSRALGLLGSNFAARLVLAATLWLVLHGVGEPVSFGTALVTVVATSLLAGIVPIPGGIGIAEAFMTGVLVLTGVPEATAFAATITYRTITFYLPAVEGFFTMKWLEAREFL